MVVIRLATKEDVDEIISFIDRSGMVFHSKATIRRMVCGDSSRRPYFIGLAVDSGIVGISIVSAKSKTLSLLYVLPEYRGRGIGRELLHFTAPKQILLKVDALGYFNKVYKETGSTP